LSATDNTPRQADFSNIFNRVQRFLKLTSLSTFCDGNLDRKTPL
jgi:hypothetical protein